MFTRDKLKEPLRLEGSKVILDEIKPEYFPYVINWRNNRELNRYINQPYELTSELEQKWYEDIYLRDNTQGFMIMLDSQNGIPFGTIGWTDYNPEKKQCICGRLLLSDQNYAVGLLEAHLMIMEYLYNFVDTLYSPIGIHNRKSLRWNKALGFELNTGELEYPSQSLVNGIVQCEMFCTKEKYMQTRNYLMDQFNIVIPVKQLMTKTKTPPIIDTRHTTHDTRHTYFVLIRDSVLFLSIKEHVSLLIFVGRDFSCAKLTLGGLSKHER